MTVNGKPLCPSCAREIRSDDTVCAHCGGGLDAVRPEQDKYQLVHDGHKFGIALRGRIVLPGMNLREAQTTLAILNSEGEK